MKTKQESTNREQDKASAKNIRKWLRSLSSLSDPHPSVKDIGERRRAQLLNIITLILVATFLLGLLARPAAVGTFIFLLLLMGTASGFVSFVSTIVPVALSAARVSASISHPASEGKE